MQSLEKNKQYREDKNKKLSDSKMKVKIEKGKLSQNRQRSRIASLQKVSNLTKKVSQGVLYQRRKKD